MRLEKYGPNSRIRRLASAQRGFTLIELMIVILILAILVGLAVMVWITVRNRADAAAAESNLKNGAHSMDKVWFKLCDQSQGTYYDQYRDNVPPAGLAAGAQCTAQYMSYLETKQNWCFLDRPNAAITSQIRNRGLWKNRTRKTGSNLASEYYNWRGWLYGNIGVLYSHFWEPGLNAWRSNTTTYAGAYPSRPYEQLMVITVTPQGNANYNTYRRGSIIGSGSFAWNDGAGHP